MALTRADIERRDAVRLLVLRTIYEIAVAGGSTSSFCDLPTLAAHLRIDLREVLQAVQYLNGEQLLQARIDGTGGGVARLTHPGVVEVEATIRDPARHTDHFSVSVINQTIHLTNSTVGVINAGTAADINVLLERVRSSGEHGPTIADALAKLTEAVSRTESATTSERDDLLEQLRYLAQQASVPKQERTPSVGRVVVGALGKGLSVYADLAAVWTQVEPYLRNLF